MAPSRSEKDNIESFNLALKPDTLLRMSLHENVSQPQEKSETMRSHPNLAMMDASRVVSPSQIVAAANMALLRDSKQTLAWDTVLNAASSTHWGHVLRDNSFGQDSEGKENVAVVVFAVGGTQTEFQDALRHVGFKNPQPVTPYLERQKTPEEIDNFYKWYKITSDEVAMSSLEEAVLTRISTKFYV